MFDFIEEPEITNFDNLSIFEFKSTNEEPSPPQNNSPFSPLLSTTHEQDPIPSPPSLIQKTKKIAKKSKKDDFDYKTYIEEELRKLNGDELEEKARKRLVQKIRNRMSAQRSRQRNKAILENLREENQILKRRNSQLIDSLKETKGENDELKERLKELTRYKVSISSTDNDDAPLSSEELSRTSVKGQSPFKNYLFIAVMLVAVVFRPTDQGSKVQMGGLLPLLTNKVPQTGKGLAKLENVCKKYCEREIDCERNYAKNKGRELLSLQKEEKGLVLFEEGERRKEVVPLICFEGGEEDRGKKHFVLFRKQSLEGQINNNGFLYVPEVLSINEEEAVIEK